MEKPGCEEGRTILSQSKGCSQADSVAAGGKGDSKALASAPGLPECHLLGAVLFNKSPRTRNALLGWGLVKLSSIRERESRIVWVLMREKYKV